MKFRVFSVVFILFALVLSGSVKLNDHLTQSEATLSRTLRGPSAINEDDCLNSILNIIHSSENKIATKTIKALRYSSEFPGQKGKHIQYGFEVEYTMEEARVIFNNFMPEAPIFQGSREDWLKMNLHDQLKFFDKNYKRIYPQGSRKPGKMVKITQGAMAKYISDDLICDSGNFELVYSPFDSMEELFETIKFSKRLLGAGSMQVMISNPYDKNALEKSRLFMKNKLEQELGYYNFVNEADTLEKLVTGYHRYRGNSKVAAAASFNHPWLGPMTKLKNNRLKKFLEFTYTDDVRLKKEMRDYAYQVTSNKFIGGLAFRPDVAHAQGRVASEIRDCHRNLDCIESRVKRETFFLMKGKKEFQKYAKLEAFDTILTAYNADPKIYIMLKGLFPAFNDMDVVQLELYRNFLYPFRNWNSHLITLGRPDLSYSVEAAKEQYQSKLIDISRRYSTRMIKPHEARLEIMGALAEFAYESKLYEAFKSELNKMMKDNNFKALEGISLTYAPLDKTYKPMLVVA